MRFKHEFFPLINLDRIDGGDFRYYETEDGGRYKSVTTALSFFSEKGINAWRARVGEEEANKVSGRACRLGIAMHNIAEDYVNNKDNWKEDHTFLAIDRFNIIRPYLDKYCSTIHGIEIPLYSTQLKTAGTCDLVCKYRDKNTVLDFKTSARVKDKESIYTYFMQCAAYGIMLNEHYDFKPEQLVILMSVVDGTPIEFVEPFDKWESKTRKFFDLWSRGLLRHS